MSRQVRAYTSPHGFGKSTPSNLKLLGDDPVVGLLVAAISERGNALVGQEGRDPLGTIRDPDKNGIHQIPAWEFDVSEDEFKQGMADAEAGRFVDMETVLSGGKPPRRRLK